jgi:hypothetical protein
MPYKATAQLLTASHSEALSQSAGLKIVRLRLIAQEANASFFAFSTRLHLLRSIAHPFAGARKAGWPITGLFSNFHPDRVMDLIVHNQVIPAVNQIETHPFNQQIETQKFLQENTVQIESWGPFAEGKHNIFQHEVLRSIADTYQKSVAQIILRWLTQRGVVAIPKSVRKERIEENFNVFNFDLNPEDMAAIARLDTKTSSFFDHRDPNIVKALGQAQRPT